MTVEIKGMEMPKSCRRCHIRDEFWCTITNNHVWGCGDFRDPECPLREGGKDINAFAPDVISRQAVLGEIETVCFSRDWSKFRVDHGSNGTRDYIINYIKQMPSVQPEQRWIPVSERLPETDTDVLITNGIGTYVGWIDPEDKDWRVDSVSEYFMKDIVAWMPLPLPWKGE